MEDITWLGFVQGPEIINFESKFQLDVVLFPHLGHALQLWNQTKALSELTIVFLPALKNVGSGIKHNIPLLVSLMFK